MELVADQHAVHGRRRMRQRKPDDADRAPRRRSGCSTTAAPAATRRRAVSRAGSQTAPAPARSNSPAAIRAADRHRARDTAPTARMPLAAGARPVTAAVHTVSACVGRSVARCSTAPPSKMRPKFGSRPSATAGEIMSSVAPSRASTTIRPVRDERPRVRPATRLDATASRGPSPQPRAATGTASEIAIIAVSSTALTGPPRRPRCASAMSRNTAADADKASAVDRQPRVICGSSTSPNPRD